MYASVWTDFREATVDHIDLLALERNIGAMTI
jgi:hypothetical protein